MKIVASIVISIFLTLIVAYFVLFQKLPEAIKIEGFFAYLVNKNSVNGLLGTFIGMMAVSLLYIVPFMFSVPDRISSVINTKKLSSEPNKAMGEITKIARDSEFSVVEVRYNSQNKSFKVPTAILRDDVTSGQNVAVFYDPRQPDNAYLDFSEYGSDAKDSEKESNTVFKLIELNPKYEISPNSYELTGELHGGVLQGKKVSLIYEFEQSELSQLVPGKLYPCSVSSDNDNFDIMLNLN